ncbi:hypothetical protein [Asticcacaulis benevestitus]|uniref:Uncharacterized protein n=1 Tax=Asticcacaulis benevestitus DSM 16100 = ATCC BAA-896 TaxID=1121022 RepID=V4NLX5_9CAUL|nr:hypothetical protein [Asticcacaulis benevestitus]ESQ82812.1 hypothetical protein ABENE_20700 [Asticcacaulis benevestitus DSM 16100 = ATCC BAA-896]
MSTVSPIAAMMVLSIASIAMPAASAPAEATGTAVTAFDAYIDRTFGASFVRVAPTQLISPDPHNKLGAGEPSALLSAKVAWRERAQLKQDLPLPSDFRTPLILTKGTVFYKSQFRRAAEDAGIFEAWCGPYHFKWGINLDRDGWNIICLQKLADGKMAGYFQPHPIVYYTNGTSKVVYYPTPPAYASQLVDQKRYDIDFPQMESVIAPAKAMTLGLYAERPAKDSRTDLSPRPAYWGLFPDGPYNGLRIRNEPAGGTPALTRILVGDQVIQAAYHEDSRSYGAPSIDLPRDSDPKPALSGPIDQDLGYTPWYQPGEATIAPQDEMPWRWGTLRLKPETLSVTSGLLKKDTTVLTLKAQRVERHRIVNAPKPAFGVYLFQDDDYVYEWQAIGYQPDGMRFRDRLLCGTGHVSSAISKRDVTLCVPMSPLNGLGSAERKSYDISARGWNFWSGMQKAGYLPYETVADPDAAPGDITIDIRVDAGTDTNAELRVGTVEAGGEFVAGDRLYLPYDKDGVAKLHLWDKTLEIRRDAKLFSGTLVDHGSGFGPYYGAQ